MKKIITDRNVILTIIIVGFLIRLLYLPVPFIINVADGAGYVAMADEALRGHWGSFFDDYIYRTPLYPLFIALIKIIFGPFWRFGLAWIQHLLAIAMAVLIYLIGKKVFNTTTGFIAGLITASNAYHIYWEHNSMSDFFSTFMTVFSFYFFLRALTGKRKKDYLVFGILFGLNLLVRPLFQAFFVVFPFLIYFFTSGKNFKKRFRTTIKRFAYIIVPAIIIIIPWFFQHWYRHRYIGFTPFTGVQLMVRTQNYMDFESPLKEKEKLVYLQTMIEVAKCDAVMISNGSCGQVAVAGWADLQRKLGYSAVKTDQALTAIAVEAIKKNPGRYFKETLLQMRILLTTYRRINFFADMDLGADFQKEYLQRIKNNDPLTILHQRINWFLTFKPTPIIILAFLGMALAVIRKNLKALLFILIIIYIILVTAALEEGGVTRYRIPAEPFIFIFTAYLMASFIKGVIYLVKEIRKANNL